MRLNLLTRISLSLFVATCIAGPAQAQPYQALPVDEAGEVPEFAAWREGLIDAVRRRDTEAVVALADPNISLSYGDSDGHDTFRAWLNGMPNASWTGEYYWQQLEQVLTLGGTWEDRDDGKRHFCAPYTYTAELPPEMDLFDVLMVVEPDAPLYSGPSAEEPVVATLDYDIATITDNPGMDPDQPEKPYWIGIRTADGAHEGYVDSRAVRFAVDYRACFTEGPDGTWIWDLFIAGD